MKTKLIFIILTLIFVIQIDSYSQWTGDPDNPMEVCNELLNQTAPIVTNDGSGGYFVFWVDRRDYGTTTTSDLYGQRLNASGNKLWVSSGKKIVDSIPYYINPNVVYTESGTVIILYSTTNDGNKIWERKLDLNGNDIWPDPSALFVQSTAHIGADEYSTITDNSGGVIVSYQLTYNGGATFIFSQRVDANGNLKWDAANNGLNLSVNDQSRSPIITTDGRGGANIFWFNVPGPYYIWKTHIDSSGNFLPKDTLKLSSNNYPQIRAVYDGAGGAVVAWANYPGSGSSGIYAQRVDITGTELWNINGVPVCNETSGQDDPNIERTSDGSYIIVWTDRRRMGNSHHVYSQKIGPAGNPQWNQNGVLITNFPSTYPKPDLIRDNSGGAYVFVLNSQTDFSVARVNGDSTLVWTPSLRTIASQDFIPFYEVFRLIDHPDGAVVIWQTFSGIGSNGIGIYGAKINSNGTINIQHLSSEIPDRFTLHQNYPNPFNPVTKIKFDVTFPQSGIKRETSPQGVLRTNVKLVIYDAIGKEIESLVNEQLSPGSYEVEFDGSNFSSGIYFYELFVNSLGEAGNFVETKRMVLLK